MSDIVWSYRDSEWSEDRDLVGYDVEADGGKIGTVDEASTEAAAQWLVVDTGFWIFGKKRVVPARAVKQINVDDRVVHLDMTKAQVKDAPDHHEDWREPSGREPFTGYYDPFAW